MTEEEIREEITAYEARVATTLTSLISLAADGLYLRLSALATAGVLDVADVDLLASWCSSAREPMTREDILKKTGWKLRVVDNAPNGPNTENPWSDD